VPTELIAYALRWYAVPAANPFKLLANRPVPVPSVVFESEIVGLAVVLQQTPLTVTDAPPSEVIFPPEKALVCVISLIDVVVTVENPLATPEGLKSNASVVLINQLVA